MIRDIGARLNRLEMEIRRLMVDEPESRIAEAVRVERLAVLQRLHP